jgi:predicted secreted Zn-dependent protease
MRQRIMKILALASLLLAFPCTAGAETLPPIPEGFRPEVKQAPYDVQGNSVAALVAEKDAKGPMDDGKRFFAKTEWNLHWNYRYAARGGAFVITTLFVTAEITYRMPRRIPPPTEPDRVAAQWAQFMEALTKHEEGHAQNAIEHGKALYGALRAHGPFVSMQALKDFIQAEGDQCIAETREADKQYDARTGHGATQGATLH